MMADAVRLEKRQNRKHSKAETINARKRESDTFLCPENWEEDTSKGTMNSFEGNIELKTK